MKELEEWLKVNKIQYEIIDKETLNIPELGKCFFQDISKMNSALKINEEDEVEFNCCEMVEVLAAEGLQYVIFQFGDNWYYTPTSTKDFQLNILKHVGTKVPSALNLGELEEYDIVNLGCHTAFELLNGSFLPKDWVRKAKWCGHKAIGICDNNTMAACYNLQKECDAAGITPVFGYSLTFECNGEQIGAKVYVQTNVGLKNLLRIQKAIMVDSENQTIPFGELLRRGAGNVIVLDKYSSEWIYSNPTPVEELLKEFQKVLYQIDLTEFRAERIDIKVLQSAKYYFDNLYKQSLIEPVLLTDAYYLDKNDYKNKILLNKIASGAAHEQSHEQYFKDLDEHYELFDMLFSSKWNIPEIFKECCNNARIISDNAVARFENTRNFMPKYDMTNEEKRKYGTTHNMFNQLLEEGLERLIPEADREKYRKQMEYEKYIIESTNNVDYLLVQYDTCNYARRNNILVGCGRGSAAGSLLLYLLGITLIDPLKYDLIFERFLLPERAGLYQSDATIIGEDYSTTDCVEVQLEGQKNPLKIASDAQLYISRNGENKIIYASDLQEGDDILFDNKDALFTINEL